MRRGTTPRHSARCRSPAATNATSAACSYATRAYYVVGIQRPGGMGATLASFADEEAATRLAAEEGGRVLRFDEIDQAVLQGVGGDHPHRHPAH